MLEAVSLLQMDSMLDEHELLWILFPASLILLLTLSGFVFFFPPLGNKKEQLSEKEEGGKKSCTFW